MVENKKNFIFGLVSGVALMAIILLVIVLCVFLSGNKLTLNKANDAKANPTTQEQNPAQPITSEIESKIKGQVGTFYEVDLPICKDGNKPIIRMFSTTWCAHCQWAKPAFEAVVKEYKDKIVAHNWELDTNDDSLTVTKESKIPDEENAVYAKYNPDGSIPTFIFGCKYFRIGTGNEQTKDLEAEKKEFRQLIDDLLKSK